MEQELLPLWAEAVLARDSPQAALVMARAERLADSLTGQSQDHLLEVVVQTAAGSRARQRELLAAQIRAYGRGVKLFSDGEPAAALDAFRRTSSNSLRRGGSIAWARACVEQARMHFRRRELDAAERLLNEAGPALGGRGFSSAEGRLLWLRGAVQFEQEATASVRDYDTAIALLERSGEPENAAIVHGTAADTWRVMGERGLAWNHLAKALDQLDSIREVQRRYNLLLNASLFARSDGLVYASLAYLNAAVAATGRARGPGSGGRADQPCLGSLPDWQHRRGRSRSRGSQADAAAHRRRR